MVVRRIAVLAALIAALALAGACGGSGEGDGADDAPAGPAFTRAPYLTRVTETAARLDWIAPPGARVTLSAAAPDGSAPVPRGRAFSGLEPDTRYGWTAAIDGGETATGTFTTAPADLARPLEVIAFGDYGAPNDSSRAVAGLIAGLDPRLLVTAGDNAYLVALPELLDDTTFGPLREVLARAPNYGTVGDHDVVFRTGQRALAEAFDWPAMGERHALRYGPVQVIALGLRGDADDAPFLRRALARPGPLARLVVTHQPLKAGNPLLPVIAAGDVTAVIAGHLHAYERREVAGAPGVPFFTVGTGGAPRNDERTPRSADAVAHVAAFGVMRVRLEAARATYEFIDVDGAVRDRVVLPLVP